MTGLPTTSRGRMAKEQCFGNVNEAEQNKMSYLGAQRRSSVARKRWLITICKHQVLLEVSDQDLDLVLKYLREHKVNIIEGATERHGKYRQLHYHGIAELNGSYKGLTRYNNFRIYWKQIRGTNLFWIRKYIYKNKKI